MPNDEKAIFVRSFDQMNNDPSYKIVTPEGRMAEFATNKDGRNSRMAWGSNVEIGKAIGALEANGDTALISRLMGDKHKVRNFYNNIADPNSPLGDVTIDTHAVAAQHLRPHSGNSAEVAHNFQNSIDPDLNPRPAASKGSATTGVQGTYGLNADVYRDAAEQRGVLPREMQSITWEAVRGMFPDTFKTAKNMGAVDDMWRQYQNGNVSIDQVRRMISDAAGGIRKPTWE